MVGKRFAVLQHVQYVSNVPLQKKDNIIHWDLEPLVICKENQRTAETLQTKQQKFEKQQNRKPRNERNRVRARNAKYKALELEHAVTTPLKEHMAYIH